MNAVDRCLLAAAEAGAGLTLIALGVVGKHDPQTTRLRDALRDAQEAINQANAALAEARTRARG